MVWSGGGFCGNRHSSVRMVGELCLDKILCEAFIGINPDELCYTQEIELEFSFKYDWNAAILTDSIESAVDYAALTEELKTYIESSKFNLLETLVANLAKKILDFSSEIISAKVACTKVKFGSKAEVYVTR